MPRVGSLAPLDGEVAPPDPINRLRAHPPGAVAFDVVVTLAAPLAPLRQCPTCGHRVRSDVLAVRALMPDALHKFAPVPLAVGVFCLVILDVHPFGFHPGIARRAPMAPNELLSRSPLLAELMRFLEALACQQRVAVPPVMQPFFELRDKVAILPAFVQKQRLHGLFLRVAAVGSAQHQRHVREINAVLLNEMPVIWHQFAQWVARVEHRHQPSCHPLGRGLVGLGNREHRPRLLRHCPANQRLQCG